MATRKTTTASASTPPKVTDSAAKAARPAKKPAAAKRPAAAKAAAPTTAARSASASAQAPTRPAAPPKAAAQAPAAAVITPEQRAHYIEVAAFYIAERRGFAPGDPMADWLAAQAEIDRAIATGRLGRG